jgi:UDP-N-acetylmuramate dehydrogenase
MPVPSALARLRASLTGDVRADESMAKHTTFRVGGPAAILAQLDTLTDVKTAVEVLADEGVDWIVVGKGSNLLVADSGYDGAVLVLGREFKRHRYEAGILSVGAATTLAVLVQDAFHNGYVGLAWAVGIPGTLGGALAMNAGTRAGSVGETVETVTVFVPGQGLALLRGSEIAWAYRSSGLAGRGIILEAALRVSESDPARVRAELERYLKERKATQPLGAPSAGSVFTNPEGDSAGRLIEAAGLKGLRRGGAQVSNKHANFIVNSGSATACDIVGLIRKVQMTVRDTHGVDLKPEIRFLGRFEEE